MACPDGALLVVINQTGPGGFRQSEVATEIRRSFPDSTILALPYDRKLADAAWDGRVIAGRGFRRAVGAMARTVVRSLS